MAGTTGTFRLLVSDQPLAIDDFGSLDVSFERARVFRAQRDGTADAATGTDAGTETATANATAASTPSPTSTATPTGTVTESPTETEDGSAATESDAGGEADREERGFTVVALDGATVDLTRLIGAKASGVFAGELETGRYTKIELYAAEAVGIVEGEQVDVKVPSGKLMLTEPFSVDAGGTVSVVFDINVVKKGPTGYSLLPVVSESGVAGEDVEVEEVDSEGATGTETATPGGSETASDGGSVGAGNDNVSEGEGQGQSYRRYGVGSRTKSMAWMMLFDATTSVRTMSASSARPGFNTVSSTAIFSPFRVGSRSAAVTDFAFRRPGETW